MPLCSEDSNDLKEQDLIRHHQYIACKDYDRSIMNKLNSLRNLDLLIQSIQQDQSEQIDNNSPKNKRIMLVEDEDDIVMLFKMILELDAGLKVDSFTDPFSALNNFRSGQYDLILIDIVLPKLNGFELYHKIRKLDDKVKICFLTAGEMYHEEIRIRKPVANEDLIRRVKNVLGIQ
jgi:CheY-like chemotaxis protein